MDNILRKYMHNSYQDIFNQRGNQYHSAMKLFPDARKREFGLIIEDMDIDRGQIICDMPSGGGYLKNNFPIQDITLISIDSSQVFIDSCAEDAELKRYLCPLNKLPLEENSVNTLISLAGLHHENNRIKIFSEVHRILKNNGIFCLADVRTGSATDAFLNVFVDKYNSMGHKGQFLDSQDISDLEQVGFSILKNRSISYHWEFDSTDNMCLFCMLLFGLDQTTPENVLNGIDQYLGYTLNGERCLMNWELDFIKCEKCI